MRQHKSCGICGGSLTMRYPGVDRALSPDQLSPTSHPLGEHTAILRCDDCATLQQPSLLEHGDLPGLYRDMRDDAYLDEEAGRRRTARRLLDILGAHTKGGRLLDVGCGHGLLLGEARKLGYETLGLEISTAGAAFGRDTYGLDIREQSIEELDDDERFDVITLIDVLEHLPNPRATIERCHRLLASNGLLCVVTPDPESMTARIAGRRWWALKPAHSYLIPGRTLLELLIAQGLVIAADEPFVRSFSLRYWLDGAMRNRHLRLFDRGTFRARAGRAILSTSLGDERVVVASRVDTLKPTQCLVKDRDGSCKVHVVLPAYNAASTIGFVARTLPTGAADRALLVDDCSPDETTSVALAEGFEVIRHPANRGYGANQKTCYVRAALDGADIVVMVHADHQYDPGLVGEMVQPIAEGHADVVIGSRLLEDRAIAGGMPRWKWIGNRFLTTIENWAFRRSYSEYHTGYRAFSIEFLREIPFLRNSDSFVFDQEIFAQIVKYGGRVEEIPIPTRYFLEASSVSFSKSVEYGLQTLSVLARFRADEWAGRWPLLRRPAVQLADKRAPDYERAVIHSQLG